MPRAKGDGLGTGEHGAAGLVSRRWLDSACSSGFHRKGVKAGPEESPVLGACRTGHPLREGSRPNKASVGRSRADSQSRWNEVCKGFGPGDAVVTPARLPGGRKCTCRLLPDSSDVAATSSQ